MKNRLSASCPHGDVIEGESPRVSSLPSQFNGNGELTETLPKCTPLCVSNEVHALAVQT